MTNKLDDEIVKWSKKVFPDLTLEKQLVKLEEELTEWIDCIVSDNLKETVKEMADVYIVSRILKNRFNSHIGGYFCGLLESKQYMLDDLEQAIKDKMKINKARKWDKVDGVYKHKEDKK